MGRILLAKSTRSIFVAVKLWAYRSDVAYKKLISVYVPYLHPEAYKRIFQQHAHHNRQMA